MENDGNSGITAKVDPQIKQAMRKAVSYLESIQGVKPVKVKFNYYDLILSYCCFSYDYVKYSFTI